MDSNGIGNCITLQKNISFHLVDGTVGHNASYFAYPTLPSFKSPFRLFGSFWTFKYLFDQPHNLHHNHPVTRAESDACQMYLYLTKNNDNSDIEFQLYCDSGSKASLGGWTLTHMKWVSVKVAFINPGTKQISSHKKTEGVPRCGKLLCLCRQTKVCLRKQNFCSPEFLQSFYVINKCAKPRPGMQSSYYCSIDALVTVTFFAHHPKSTSTSSSNVTGHNSQHFWKSHQEASQRIFHAKIGTDFKLVANREEFPCHKCILAGHSEVFSRMFSSDPQKRQQPSSLSSTRLVMEGMSAVGVESFLKYLYYGDTTFSQLPISLTFELWKASEKYGIPHLRKTSFEILISKSSDDLDCGTALEIFQHVTSTAHFAISAGSCDKTECSSLKRMALQCFTTKYSELVKSKEFVKLFDERREDAQEILIKIHKNKMP